MKYTRTNHRRIQATGDGYYHVISRIYNKQFLLEGCERAILYRYIRNASKFCGVEVLTFAIMSNHIHLLIKVPQRRDVGDAELVQRMRGLYGDKRTDTILSDWAKWEKIDGSPVRRIAAQKALKARMYSLPQFCKTFKEIFAMSYNERNSHITSVWGGQRYKSVLLSPDPHTLFSVASYIDNNPVRAKMCRDATTSPVSALGMALSGDGFARGALRNLIKALQGDDVNWVTAAARYMSMLGCDLPESFDAPRSPAKTDGLRAVRLSSKNRHLVDSRILGPASFVLKCFGTVAKWIHVAFALPKQNGEGLFAAVRLRGDDSGYKKGRRAEKVSA